MTSKFTTTKKQPLQRSAVAWKPMAYARRAVKFLLEHAAAGLLLDPGLGKTSITLAAFKILKREGLASRMLVVAPRRVCHLVWPKEVAKWLDFNELKIVVLHGAKKEQRLDEDADIYVINPEGLKWLLETGKKRLSRLGIDTLCIDESSKFKRSDTQRFKTLRPFLPKFRRRWILTGSPAPNGLLDLFGQVYILDLGNALGEFVTHYRANYFSPTGFGGFTYKIDEGGEKTIYKKLKNLCLRMDAEDYLELPQVIPNKIEVELPEEARRVYDELEDEMYTVLQNEAEIVAVSAGVLTTKLSQVANGGLYYGEGDVGEKVRRRTQVLHEEKSEALADLVEELNGQPLLVAYEYGHDLERLLKTFGKSTPYIGGGVTDKQAAKIELAWNAGDIPLLLGQPAAMGHGLNFQEGNCAHVAWYSIIWDYELYDQFNRRVRRQGNKAKRVFLHHFVAKDTVDEVKLQTLGWKHRTQKKLLDALRTYVRARRATR